LLSAVTGLEFPSLTANADSRSFVERSCTGTTRVCSFKPGGILVTIVGLTCAGLVYRGAYMVNWSPRLGTAVSDLEVEYSEEPGHLYFFRWGTSGTAQPASFGESLTLGPRLPL